MLQESERAFARCFNSYAKLRGISDKDLHPLLNHLAASPEIISNWRRGRSSAPLAAIPIISKALGIGGDSAGQDDPTFILREMGLLGASRETEAARISYDVQRLEMRLRNLRNELGQLDRSNGVASIARIARDSTEWAVAIWPIVAGPISCRMHVEDRIDLKRVDEASTTSSTVFEDPLWHDILRRTHAIPGQTQSRWLQSDSSVSKWTISHARTPTLPNVRAHYPSAPSVCVYGINIDSGANEVAKLVSVALGYGLTMTRDEAMELMGIPAWLGATEWIPRARAHQNHLDNPPTAVVWAHHAPPLEELNPDVFAVQDDNVPIFWLRESEDLFRAYCTRWPRANVDELLHFRKLVDQMASVRANITVIDVNSSKSLDASWNQHLHVAKQILEHPAFTTPLASAQHAWPSYREQDKDIASSFLNWLEDERAK